LRLGASQQQISSVDVGFMGCLRSCVQLMREADVVAITSPWHATSNYSYRIVRVIGNRLVSSEESCGKEGCQKAPATKKDLTKKAPTKKVAKKTTLRKAAKKSIKKPAKKAGRWRQ
jgi:hypothetical protein